MVSGLVLESGMELEVCDVGWLSDAWIASYPGLPKGHEQDVVLVASSIRNKGEHS